MKGWHGWLLLAGLLGTSTWVQAQQQAPVDLDPYLKKDIIGALKISPDGDYYAMTVPLEDRTVLSVMRRSDKKITATFGGAKNSVVSNFWWVNKERVVVSMAEKFGSMDQPFATGDLHAVNADGSQPLLIFGRNGLAGKNPVTQVAAVVDTLEQDDRNILISVSAINSNPTTRVDKLDVYSRVRTDVASAPVRRARFATDAAGEVRFAQGQDIENNSQLYYRDNNQAPWRLINDENSTGRVEWPLGFSADGRTAFLQSEMTEGPDAIVGMDLTTDKRTERLRDAVVDPRTIIFRHGDRQPEGAFLMHERLKTRFLDEKSETALQYRMLEKAFPGQAVRITSATTDGKKRVVRVWSDRNPGDFYLFDSQSKAADLIFSQRSWFDPEQVATTRSVSLKARDGLSLHGFLTVPHGAGGGKLPLVVVPHGGPYGLYDEWDFDSESQLLAEAGYAVLRINFRGSGNYGRAFTQAGAQQWGLTMQDDLTDATRWAIAENIADPSRICLYGASYGAYASLMGISREPDLYRCAVGYVGVYDLELLHKDGFGASKSMRNWTSDWIGNRDNLAIVSPVELAERIKAPVFLAAGGADHIAPVVHTRRMQRSLKAAGVPVETLYFENEGHGFYTEPHRREFYTQLLDFLSRHLGGAKAK